MRLRLNDYFAHYGEEALLSCLGSQKSSKRHVLATLGNDKEVIIDATHGTNPNWVSWGLGYQCRPAG